MLRLTKDKSACVILYSLKLIKFVIRETSKERITVVQPREIERNSKFVGSISVTNGIRFTPELDVLAPFCI